MKRKMSVLLCVIIAVLSVALTACGGDKQDLSDSKYVGTWKATTIALKDETGELEGNYTLTLNGDGTGQFVDDEETTNITWQLTSNGFKTKGDTKLTFTDEGDNIKTKIIGVDLIFERQ